MKIDIQGNSGCKIDIVKYNNTLSICKYTEDKTYFNRLIAQANKQKTTVSNLTNIHIPTIYSIITEGNKTSVNMEYIYSKNYISFFETANIDDIRKFVNTICLYINNEILYSKITAINTSIIMKKVVDVIYKSNENIYVKSNSAFKSLINDIYLSIKHICEAYDIINIPVGICHGDLTLSNILFNGNQYYLIDFLDSYIETPLQDICKLRQDTMYHWSTLMYEKKYDKQKINVIYKYLDNYIDTYFSNYAFYKYYTLFQLINMLRIVPYIKSNKVATFLYNKLIDLRLQLSDEI